MSAVAISRFHASARAEAPDRVVDAGASCQPRAQSRPSAVVLPLRPPPTKAPTFEDAILPHLDAAYNLARWLVHDPVEAEDIVQDACLRALRFFPSFRTDSGKAWLLRIVRNTVYSRLRKPARRLEVAFGDPGDGPLFTEIADPAPGPDAILQRVQEAAQLKAAMALLPMDLRECLVLRELEELSYSEIARITAAPIGTVMSRLHRGRSQLTALWRENAAAPTPRSGS